MTYVPYNLQILMNAIWHWTTVIRRALTLRAPSLVAVTPPATDSTPMATTATVSSAHDHRGR